MEQVINALNNLQDGYLNLSDLGLYNKHIIDSPTWAQVRHLNISNNKLTKLPYCPNLETLDCSNNGIKLLQQYDNLYDLNCANNSIKCITGFKNLTILNCANNPVKLGNLQSLEQLICHDCGLNELDISIYPALHTLNAANNYLQFIQNHDSLRDINLSNNRLTHVPLFSAAETVVLNYNKIRRVPDWNVRDLEIDYNLLESFPSSAVLTRLSCGNNNIIVTAATVINLPALTYLDCSNSQPNEPFFIMKTASLRQQYKIISRDHGRINNTFLMESINYTIALHNHKNRIECINLPALKRVFASNVGLKTLPTSEYIEVIDVQNNDLATAKWPVWLHVKSITASHCNKADMPPLPKSLTELVMSHNKLTQVLDLGHLTRFAASHNKITNMTFAVDTIIDLDLSYNELTQISCNWPVISMLNLSHNKLDDISMIVAPEASWIELTHNMIFSITIVAPMADRIMIDNNQLVWCRIEAPNLQTLHASHNEMIKININAPNLRELLLQNNMFRSIPGFDQLRILNISFNKVEKLESYPLLTRLIATNNELTEAPSGPNLVEVDISNNKITNILPLWPKIKQVNYIGNSGAIRNEWPLRTVELPARKFTL